MDIEQRLKDLGIVLPETPAPVGSYRPWVITGNLLYVSGQLPIVSGRLACSGKAGDTLNVDTAREAARITALNGLAQAKAALGSLDRISGCVRIGGFINSAPGFIEQPAVLNGASDLLVEVLGEKGRHARAAVGVSELPLDAAVEVEFLFEIITD